MRKDIKNFILILLIGLIIVCFNYLIFINWKSINSNITNESQLAGIYKQEDKSWLNRKSDKENINNQNESELKKQNDKENDRQNENDLKKQNDKEKQKQKNSEKQKQNESELNKQNDSDNQNEKQNESDNKNNKDKDNEKQKNSEKQKQNESELNKQNDKEKQKQNESELNKQNDKENEKQNESELNKQNDKENENEKQNESELNKQNDKENEKQNESELNKQNQNINKQNDNNINKENSIIEKPNDNNEADIKVYDENGNLIENDPMSELYEDIIVNMDSFCVCCLDKTLIGDIKKLGKYLNIDYNNINEVKFSPDEKITVINVSDEYLYVINCDDNEVFRFIIKYPFKVVEVLSNREILLSFSKINDYPIILVKTHLNRIYNLNFIHKDYIEFLFKISDYGRLRIYPSN